MSSPKARRSASACAPSVAEVRDQLQQRITELVTHHVQGYGGAVEIDYERGYPVVVNSDAETEFARRVAEELVGPERTIAPFGPVTGSEDFAYYLEHRPGCFLRLGNGEAAPDAAQRPATISTTAT